MGSCGAQDRACRSDRGDIVTLQQVEVSPNSRGRQPVPAGDALDVDRLRWQQADAEKNKTITELQRMLEVNKQHS